ADWMHGAPLEAIATLGQDDEPGTLAGAKEQHFTLSRLVGRAYLATHRRAGRRHLLDDDGGRRISFQTALDPDHDVVELQLSLAAARTAALPDFDDLTDDYQRGRPDQFLEVSDNWARRGGAFEPPPRAQAPRYQDGGRQERRDPTHTASLPQ